jgi:predicted MFS family arabinose efflux permease
MAAVAVAAGVMDIILFLRVEEPPNAVMPGEPVLKTILAPLKDRDYRPFVVFSCVWAFVVMFAAAFMQVYLLKVLKLTVWHASIMWCVCGIGIVLTSAQWGRLADQHGHRPILAICIGLKSMIVWPSASLLPGRPCGFCLWLFLWIACGKQGPWWRPTGICSRLPRRETGRCS